MRIGRSPSVMLCLVLTACGSSSNPAEPSAPPASGPTLTGLTINGPGAVLTSTTADYTATASFSNQTTQAVTATWSAGTDRATVSSTGRVTGQLHGSFTLTAAYQGQSAAKAVNVVSNYDGKWSGVVVRLTCQLNGALGQRITPQLCPAGPNERMPMSFTVSQPPPFTEVTAEINLANTILNARGTVSADGKLLLGGDTEYEVADPVRAGRKSCGTPC